MTDPPRTLCLLAEPYLSGPQIKSLEYAINNSGIRIPLVVVNEQRDPNYDPELKAKAVNDGIGLDTIRLAFDVLRRERAWTFVIAEKKIAEIFGSGDASSRRTHVENVSCLSDSEFHYTTPIVDGNWSELPPDTVELVRQSSDVVVRYGFGLIRGEILTATEYGVLSFHPADIREYRGMGPPRAYLDGRESMGVTLQRLSEDIDGGEIVAYREADVSDCATLWEVYQRLHELQEKLLAEGISNIRNNPTGITKPESLGPYYSTRSRRTLSFSSRILYRNVAGRIKRKIP